MLSPLTLAYVGDAVHDLHVRSLEAGTGRPVHSLHMDAVSRVCCRAQSEALERIEPTLSAEEAGVVRRGRNCHSRHGAPKGSSPETYTRATALEALLGYLYLSGQDDRMAVLLDSMYTEV